jgi:biopolymer transport protein ExbB
MRRPQYKSSRRSALLAFIVFASLSTIGVLSTTPAAHAQDATDAPAAAAPAQDAAATPAAAPAEAPAAPPAAAAPATERETIKNPYGLDALWKAGDFVARFTLIVLIAMSMGSWYVIITKLFEQSKLFRQAKDAQKTFWTSDTVENGIRNLKEGSPFRYIAESGTEASQRHEGALIGKIDLHTWVTMSIQRASDNVQNRLQDGLAYLATVGSTAPFVGLFGTVWGIYHALTAIGIAGQASIDKVAGPVGESLIMTAIGLAVAVPAVLGYNGLVRRNKVAMEKVRAFSADLYSVLMGNTAPAAAAAGGGASETPVRPVAARA